MSLTSWNIPAASFSWSVVGVGAVLGKKNNKPCVGKKKKTEEKDGGRGWEKGREDLYLMNLIFKIQVIWL